METMYVKIEDAAVMIGLSPSTVKKYYLLIEEKGYAFKRSKQGRVLFGEKDIEMLQRVIHIKNQPGKSVQDAVDEVVTSITDVTVYDERNQSSSDLDKKELEVIKQFMEVQSKNSEAQQELNKEILKQLLEMKDLMRKEISENREAMMLELKETKELLMKQEEVVEQPEEKPEEIRKPWWKRLFEA